MVGGGAQVVVFTTGLGTPTGNPIAPVIKITGNARTAQTMADNIDVDVSGVIDDRETLDAAADAAVRRGARRWRRAGRPPPSGSATASSRSIAAIRRSECLRGMPTTRTAAVAQPTRVGRVPLDDLRAAVPRRDDQLRRSPGHRHPQADAAGAVRLDARSTTATSSSRSSSPTRSASCSPAGSWIGSGTKRGFALALIDLGARRDGDTRRRRASARRRRWCSAPSASPTRASVAGFMVVRFAARARRVGQLSRGDQDRRRMVPAARARVRHRALQLRHEHRRAWSRRWWCRVITARFGWYWAFVITGALGFAVARRCGWRSTIAPSSIRASAPPSWRYIRSDPPETAPTRMPWASLLRLPADVGVRGRRSS